MPYFNSIDALRKLLCDQNFGAYISGLSNDGSRLSNGLEYCLVEITCKTGTQFGIQSYGKEAIDLYKEVTKFIRSNIKSSIVCR